MKRLYNGIFYTMDDMEIRHELYINDHGMIIDEPTHQINVEHIDMKGQFVYPAFIDCHLHLMGYGQFLSRLHAKGISTKQAVLQFVSNHLNLLYQYQKFDIYNYYHKNQRTMKRVCFENKLIN
mgnify:CR=1 FL=1